MTDITDITPKKILVCQLRQIGDVLLATPSLRLLKQKYPDATIDILTEKKCLPVLENNPYINEVWSIDRRALKNPLKALAYYAKVGRKPYDLIVDFQQLPRCKWVVRFSKAPVKLSFEPHWYNKHLYTHWSKPKIGYAAMCKASVLAPLGIDWNGERPEIWLTDNEKQAADVFLTTNRIKDSPFITIDPSHRRETRRWPARHFAGMMQQIVEHRPETKFIVLYGPGELELAKQVVQEAGCGIVPNAMLTLREMAALQSRAILHLGNCSAPRHFAVAVNTPSLTIHGATGYGWRFPSDDHISVTKDIDCKWCNKNYCETRTCLEEFHPNECIDKALSLMTKGLEKKTILA